MTGRPQGHRPRRWRGPTPIAPSSRAGWSETGARKASARSVAHLLGAESLHLSYPTRTVFDAVTIGVHSGDRIGIVGRNGDGKSSLVQLLAGRLEPDGGRVTRRRGVQLGVLDQSDALDAGEPVGTAIVGDRPRHEWARDAKVRDVVGGLVADIDWQAEVGTLSGGQRRRVALAALLVGDWDIIALDEDRKSTRLNSSHVAISYAGFC